MFTPPDPNERPADQLRQNTRELCAILDTAGDSPRGELRKLEARADAIANAHVFWVLAMARRAEREGRPDDRACLAVALRSELATPDLFAERLAAVRAAGIELPGTTHAEVLEALERDVLLATRDAAPAELVLVDELRTKAARLRARIEGGVRRA